MKHFLVLTVTLVFVLSMFTPVFATDDLPGVSSVSVIPISLPAENGDLFTGGTDPITPIETCVDSEDTSSIHSMGMDDPGPCD